MTENQDPSFESVIDFYKNATTLLTAITRETANRIDLGELATGQEKAEAAVLDYIEYLQELESSANRHFDVAKNKYGAASKGALRLEQTKLFARLQREQAQDAFANKVLPDWSERTNTEINAQLSQFVLQNGGDVVGYSADFALYTHRLAQEKYYDAAIGGYGIAYGIAIAALIPATGSFLAAIAVAISIGILTEAVLKIVITKEDFDAATLQLSDWLSLASNIAAEIIDLNQELNNGVVLESGADALHQVILGRVDNSLMPAEADRLVHMYSHEDEQGIEPFIKSIEFLLTGVVDNAPLIDTDSYVAKYAKLITRVVAFPLGSLDLLDSASRNHLVSESKRGDSTGLATRYALRELNPFIYDGNPAVYLKHNIPTAGSEIGVLDIENFSDEYIIDRASMLLWKIKRNVGDLELLTGSGLKIYEDRNSGESITVSPAGTEFPDPTEYIVFGSDESENGIVLPAIIGTDDIDHIYGGLGDDVIKGEGGNDYLEGSGGNDSITGGAGVDTLVGGRGDDILHLEGGTSPFAGDGDSDEATGGTGNDQYWGLSGGDSAFDVSGDDDEYYVTFEAGTETNGIAIIEDADGQGTIFYADGLALTGGNLVIATPEISIFKSTDDAFIYEKRTDLASGTDEVSIRRAGPVGSEGSVVIKNFTPGALGITLVSDAVPEVLDFEGTAGDEKIFDFIDGTTIQRFESDSLAETVVFSRPVQRISGLGGNDTIQINADIPDLLIYGDSAGAGIGSDGDDWIEVDITNVDAEAAPVIFRNGTYLFGEGGDDIIGGSQRNDWLSGGADHDFVSGRSGRDFISGGSGNDWLQGGDGHDVIFGNDDNDRIFGGAGVDTLTGGAGNDQLWGDAGDSPFFRDGTETFWDGATETVTVPILPAGLGDQLPVSRDADLGDGDGDHLKGGAGNDFLYGGEGVDFLYGQADNDVLQGEAGDDWLFGGDQNDVLWGDKDPASYDADTTPFTPHGHIQREHADGKDVIGNDHLNGGRGNDKLYGGAGNDRYYFGYGDRNDVIDDVAGIDSIWLTGGLSNTDIKLIESGGDLLVQLSSDGTPTGDQLIVSGWFNGKPVESIVIGETTILTVADIEAAVGKTSEPADGSASEALNLVLLTDSADSSLAGGTPGADTIYGLGGNDVIAGGSGDDRLIGGDGDDELSGGNDNDTLIGETGNDSLFGHSGDDVLVGGIGDDDLVGGAGNDTYTFSRGDGDDFILDVGGAADRVVFGDGINTDDVTIDVSGDNLILEIRKHGDLVGDKITIVDGFVSGTEVETIEFSGGAIWDADEISSHLPDAYALNDAVSVIGGTGVSIYTLAAELDDGFSISVSDAGGVDTLDLKVGTSGTFTFTPVLNSSARDGDDLLLDTTIVSTLGSVPNVTGEIRITDFYTDAGFIETIKFGPTVFNAPNEAPMVVSTIPDQVIALELPYRFSVPPGTFDDSPFDQLQLDAQLVEGGDLPDWLTFDTVTRTFSGTPIAGDTGIIDIALTATDAKGLIATTAFELNVGNVNVAPTVDIPIVDAGVVEGNAFGFVIPGATFSDTNLDESLTITVAAPDDGLLPGWLSYDSATSTLSGTPATADIGLVAVKVTATDSGGLTTNNTFLINVNYLNDAPVPAIPALDQAATEQASFTFSLPVGTFTDADTVHGDNLRYSATMTDGSDLPGWLFFNSSTLSFSGRPVAIFGDTDFDLRVTATDNDDASALTNFTLRVVESAGAPDWLVPHDVTAVGDPLYSRSEGVTAALDGGGYVVVWASDRQDGDAAGIFGQRFSSDGVKAGAEFAINTTSIEGQTTPVVVGLNGGGFVVGWESTHEDDGFQSEYGKDGGGVYAQRFNAAGTAVGSEFRVNPVFSGVQDQPAVTALNDGGFLFAWYSQFDEQRINVVEYGVGERGLFGQLYAADGTSVGDAFRLAGDALVAANEPSIAGLLGGGFVTAWRGSDPSGFGVVAQRYGLGGAPIGSEISVNSTADGNQHKPAVAALATGGFVIIWQSDQQDGDGGGVYGQRYNSVGSALGSEFRVNTTIANDQVDPSVFGTPDGGFQVLWFSQVDALTGTIFAQQYDDAGAKIGIETAINEHPVSLNALPSVTALANGSLAYSWTTAWDGDLGFGPTDPTNIESRLIELRPNTDVITIDPVVDTPASEFKTLAFRIEESIFFDPDLEFGDVHAVTATVDDGSALPDWLAFDPATSTLSGLPLSGDVGLLSVKITATDAAGSTAESIINIDVTATADISVTADPATFIVNTTEPLANFNPAAATLEDGSQIVVWDTTNAIYGQRYDDDGTTAIGGEFRLDAGTAGNSSDPTVSMLVGGGFIAAWMRSDGKIVGRKYDAGGVATTGEIELANIVADGIGVAALDAGDFVLSWHAASGTQDLTLQRYSGDPIPTPLGSEIIVSTGIPNEHLGIASLAGGGFIVAWSDHDTSGRTVINAQRYDELGTPTGAISKLNDNATFNNLEPAVLGLADGGYLVTWTVDLLDGDADIHGRIFNADGSARSAEWRINNFTTAPQRRSSITGTNDGGFVIAWRSEIGLISSEYGATHLQHFDRYGNPTGDVFQANLELSGTRTAQPTIAATAGGGFTVFWDAGIFVEDDEVADGILARRYGVGGGDFNLAPVAATPITDGVVDEDVPYSFFIPSDTFTDPESDKLTYRATLAGGDALPSWLTFDAVTLELAGIPGNDDVGAYAVAITATDTVGNSVAETFTLSVSNINDAPIAASDTAGLRLDTGTKTITLDVLANDVDVDSGDDPTTFSLDSVTVVGVQGSASIVANQLLFDPRTDFDSLGPNDIQTVTVNYTMSDSAGISSSSTVSIAIHNGDAIFGTDGDDIVAVSAPGRYYGFRGADVYTLGSGGSGSRYVSGGAGFGTSSTTYRVSSSSGTATFGKPLGGGIPGTMSFSGLPKKDMLLGLGSLLITFDGTDVELRLEDFDPKDVLGGPRVIETFVFDGVEYSFEEIISQGFNVNGTMASDVLTGTNIVDWIDGLAGGDTLASGDGDDTLTGGPGDDSLDGGLGNDTYVFKPGDGHDVITDTGGIDRVVFTVGLSSANAVSTQVGDDLVLTLNTTDSITVKNWYLDAGNRVETFAFTEDNLRIVDSETAETIDANHVPTIAIPIADQSATQDEAFSFAIPEGTFVDVDLDDTLTIGATLNDGSALPGWLNFDVVSNYFNGTPGAGDTGLLNVKVTATDAGGLSVSDDFEISVERVSAPPTVVAALEDRATVEGAVFSYFVAPNIFVDPDIGDSLLLTATLHDGSALPSWLAFDAQTNWFNGTVPAGAGDLSIKVTATDSFGLSASDNFQLTISTALNVIHGTSSDDTLNGTAHADQIDGLVGHDVIAGDAGDDIIYGGHGNDAIDGGSGNDWIDAGNDDDVVEPGLGDDVVFGGRGDDVITDLFGSHEIHGGNDNDTIVTGDGDDLIYGDSGNDTIDAGGGANQVYGGYGSDVITTGAGNDWIDAGNGNDIVDPGLGDDVVFGGRGDDLITDLFGNHTIQGGNGNDTIITGNGDDVLWGDPGNDTIDAGDGTNQVFAGHGDDIITTGSGDDDIDAGNDDDVVNGGAGNDTIFGGYGFDFIKGGRGDDVLTGWHNGDTYHFDRLDGNDVVVETGTHSGDVIEFGAGIAADQIWFSQSGDDLRLDLVGTPDSILVQGWYGYNEPVESFELDDGTYLRNSDIDQLVQAMATFSIPTGTDTSLPPAVAHVVDPIIAAVWQGV